MGGVIDGAARGLVHAAALHPDEAVLDQVEPADPWRLPSSLSLASSCGRRQRLAIHRNAVAALELDGDFLRRVGRPTRSSVRE